MKIELLAITPNAQKLIEQAGRTCYKSESSDGSDSIFIRGAIQRGHESILEHASATFRISEVSRALTHQLVRHRLASFSQSSQRYVCMDEDSFDYVCPESVMTGFEVKDGSPKEQLYSDYHRVMSDIIDWYSRAVKLGIKPEDARLILPNACHSEIVITANMREWRTIFKLRCERHAQLEIRTMAKEILALLYSLCPDVFADLHTMFIDDQP